MERLINNGDAPPNSENIISGFEDDVDVHDQGCGGWPPCDTPGPATTVSVLEGANVVDLQAFGYSVIDIEGGVVDNLQGWGVGVTLTVHGGHVSFLYPRGAAGRVLGGSVDEFLVANGNAVASIEGGEVWEFRMAHSGGSGGIFAEMSAGETRTVIIEGARHHFRLSGGVVTNGIISSNGSSVLVEIVAGEVQSGLFVSDDARYWISGGEFAGLLRVLSDGEAIIRGGTGLTEISIYDGNSTSTPHVEIVGSEFAVDGVPVPYGVLTASSGALNGTLESGEPLSLPFLIDGSASMDPSEWDGYIELSPAPSVPLLHPAATVLLALTVAGLGIWAATPHERV